MWLLHSVQAKASKAVICVVHIASGPTHRAEHRKAAWRALAILNIFNFPPIRQATVIGGWRGLIEWLAASGYRQTDARCRLQRMLSGPELCLGSSSLCPV